MDSNVDDGGLVNSRVERGSVDGNDLTMIVGDLLT